ncbi:MAG: ABC transporter substrate-binding protein [Rhodospirillaceae bacterium]
MDTRHKATTRLSILRGVLVGIVATAAAATAAPASAQKELLVAEPVHVMGYMPFYAAIHKGFFDAEGIKVKVTTLLGGAAHTNAVLSGQAWAFIGGPEHNAFAKAKGADIRAVVPVMVRGDTHLMTRTDINLTGDLKTFLKGKRIAVMQYGGTPHSIMLYMLKQFGLNPKTDVTIVETSHPAVLAAVASKQADFGITNEPFLTQGIVQKIWKGPTWSAPTELGPYIFTAINVPLKTIESDPKTVKGFVRAVMKGSRFSMDPAKRADVVAIGKKEVPTLKDEDINAIIDNAQAFKLWTADGQITPEMWKTALAVVRSTGMLDKDIAYDDVIDGHFAAEVAKEMK